MKTRIVGNSLILAGGALFASIAYEPATLSSMMGVERMLSEAVVVIAGLTVAVALGSAGLATLMLGRRTGEAAAEALPK